MQEAADAHAVLEHAFKGKPVDPEVSLRVRARAEKVREELRKKGVTDFAVDLLPNPAMNRLVLDASTFFSVRDAR
jgi:hypothetical protein